ILVGTSVQRSNMEIPITLALPKRVVVLVLDIKQPDADRRRKKRDGQVYEKKQSNANPPDDCSDQYSNSSIGRHDAQPGSPTAAHHSDGQTVTKKEQVSRPQAEHHRRVPIETIRKPAQGRARLKLGNRQCCDVANAPTIQIARVGVMQGMSVSPAIIGRETQYADDPSHPVICAAPAEEG